MGRRRSERRKRSPIDEALVNLTPLIDVVFVVLVMFILVAPMLELDSISLSDGKDKNQQMIDTNNQDYIVSIYLRDDNTIWVDKRQVKIEQLRTLLINYRGRSTSDKLRLFPDKEASFGMYQSVKNIAEAAGFGSLDVVLKPI
jgi:biopolymer transport protein ExbD